MRPSRFVCIHAHFYQPPRENPWLDDVEAQDSAAPFHDWNARITTECYAPNARARLLDERQRITALVNNYAHVSFNVGPTLMSWLAAMHPDTYEAIRNADRESAHRCGHGNAIAQAYGHAILPLADAHDRRTHVIWGIRDFQHRFGRAPEGMWLPETAVDRATLRLLAEHGIRFTILAPHQAARVRRAGSAAWEPSQHGSIDTRRAYRWRSHGAELAVFFYDADLAHGVAFGGLLNDGAAFAARLRDASGATASPPPLVHLATDGESYGHHHRFGEMALAYAVERLQADASIELTNYAAFLDRTGAPADEVEIVEHSSWSCAHGVERWRADCGCHSGAHPDWNQEWRQPLRESLAWLKTRLDQLFEASVPLLGDPWAARDAYVDVLLDRTRERRDAFLAAHARPDLSAVERVRVWKLLEMQRAALLMFTSCGWFFDDLAGIETVQVLRYAGRALQLAAELGTQLEPDFLARLEPARGNQADHPNGRTVYRHAVAPAAVPLPRAAAHAVISSLFDANGVVPPRAHTYEFEPQQQSRSGGGATVLAIGSLRVRSQPTEEDATYAYAALHLGGHDIHCAIGGADALARLPTLERQLADLFARESLGTVIRAIDTAFAAGSYTVRDLFDAQRRAILGGLAAQAVTPCVADLDRRFDQHRRLFDFLHDADLPIPDAFRHVAGIVLQQRLEAAVQQLGDGDGRAADMAALWRAVRQWHLTLALPPLQLAIERALASALATLAAAPAPAAARAEALLEIASVLAVTPNLWPAQNALYDFLIGASGAAPGPEVAPALRRLGERLGFAVDSSGHFIAAEAAGGLTRLSEL